MHDSIVSGRNATWSPQTIIVFGVSIAGNAQATACPIPRGSSCSTIR